jgi:hypothetical protein
MCLAPVLGTTACDGVFSLRGHVGDGAGTPIPSAVVAVYGKAFPDSGVRAKTDSTGWFEFFRVTAPFQFDARVEVDKPGHHAATAVIRKALDPHRIAVTLRPVKDELKSDVEFEDPGQE